MEISAEHVIRCLQLELAEARAQANMYRTTVIAYESRVSALEARLEGED